MPIVKRNGQMVEISDTEFASLQTPAPVGGATPLAAEQSGATPDQAKMVLTPQGQQGLAAKITDTAKQTVEGAKRLKAPAAPTAATPEQQQFQERLGKLGSLGSRIQSLVDTQISDAAQGPASISISDAYLKSLPKDKQTAYTAAVGGLNTLLAAGDSAGITAYLADINTKFSPLKGDLDVLGTLQTDVATAVAQSIAKGVIDPDKINIGVLLNSGTMKPEDLGLSESELTKVLGTNWINMTPKQLGTAMNRYNAIQNGDINELHTQLDDPLTPPSAKEDIKDKLWELGYSGRVQRVSDSELLANQVEASGKITFNGEVRDINEFLTDDSLKATFGDYLRGDEAYKAKFAKANPALAAWLDKNEEGMIKALEVVGTTDKALTETKAKNDALFKFETTDMDPAIIEALFPGQKAGTFNAGELSSSNKLWTHLQDLKTAGGASAKEATQIVEALNLLSKTNPEFMKEALAMADKDPASFQKLIMGLEQSPEEIATAARLNTPLKPLTKDTTNEEVIDWLFGPDMSASRVQAQLETLRGQAAFDKGAGEAYRKLAGIFDTNLDGKMDDVSEVYKRATANIGRGGFAAVLAGVNQATQDTVSAASAKFKVGGRMMDLLHTYITSPKDALTASEVKQLVTTKGLTPEDLMEMQAAGFKMGPGASDVITSKLAQFASDSDIMKAFTKAVPNYPTLVNAASLSELINEAGRAPTNSRRDAILGEMEKQKAQLKELQGGLEQAIASAETPSYVKVALRRDLAKVKKRLGVR